MLKVKTEQIEIYGNFSGIDFYGFTVYPDIMVTSSHLDFLIVSTLKKGIFVMKLICDFNQNRAAAHARQSAKYTNTVEFYFHLQLDLDKLLFKIR